MKRYHRNILLKHNQELKNFSGILNQKTFKFSKHSLERIKFRGDLEKILLFIKDLKFSLENVFEYYFENEIIKVCYRINFDNQQDIILVLNEYKEVITVYFNNVIDNHKTLDLRLYNKE